MDWSQAYEDILLGVFERLPKDNQTLDSNSTGNLSGYLSQEEVERHLALFANTGGGYFDVVTQTSLIVAFAVLIVFGATGNGLVCYVVARNAHMRTPRNIFIINLAISDLTLCLFTQPFNLMKVSMSVWKLADFMCKLVPMFAGTNVFVSTISITAIALDRFQVIVYPTKDSMKKVGAAVALISIWAISLLMASPLLVFNIVRQPEDTIRVCMENDALHYERFAYSIASMVFQYIVPIVMLSVAHARICNKLKYRMVYQQPTNTVNSPFAKRKNEREAMRKRKTNMLLIMIAVVFAFAWMPLNVANILTDFAPAFLSRIDGRGLLFPVCHILVLGSACTNPVLYGWLNENFRREFIRVICCGCCHRIPCFRCCPCPDPPVPRGSSATAYTRANGTSQYLEIVEKPGTLLPLQQSNVATSTSTTNLKA